VGPYGGLSRLIRTPDAHRSIRPWLFLVAGLAVVIALVPLAMTQQARDPFRRER
jgi:hypothetical protein